MKKNVMMRVASVLLVAVLMSTCVISGTFAKYTTSVDGSDSARVAKWGISSNLEDIQTFEATYNTDKILAANGTDKLVAPGAFDEGVYTLSGAPEVAYKVTFTFDAIQDVFLKAATYTCSDNNVERVIAADYNPIQWTVTLATTGTISGNGALAVSENNYDTLDEVEAAINATVINYDANKECDVSITIAWSWEFESNNDDADTVLGNISADDAKVFKVTNAGEEAVVADTDYSTTVEYELVLTAEQVN